MVPMRDARKTCADLGGPQLLLDLLGLQHTHQGRLDVLDGLVDDPVGPHVDALLLGQRLGGDRRTDVEADDHGLRGRRQHDVGLVDAADTGEDDLDLDLGMRDVAQGFFQGLHRAAHVALDDQRQFLDPALLEAAVELVQAARAAAALGQLLVRGGGWCAVRPSAGPRARRPTTMTKSPATGRVLKPRT